MIKIPVEITARHLHLSQKDLAKLFGHGHQLTKIKALSQPGEFAAKETVALIGPKSTYQKVRIVGPVRKDTQVEITATDGRILGIKAPLRISGNIKDSAAAVIKGPEGKVKLKQGVIIAKRHLHLPSSKAKKLNLRNGQKVSIRVGQERKVTFHQVIVRSGELHKLAVHLDTDEANAAGLRSCSYGELIK